MTIATFTVTLLGSGWVSFGLTNQADQAHSGMDVWTATFNGNTPIVVDSWEMINGGLSEPASDVSQGGTNDITLISGTKGTGYTTWTFSRPLTTGDSAHDVTIKNQAQTWLWAYNANTFDITVQHTNQDMFDANLIVAPVTTTTTAAAASSTSSGATAGSNPINASDVQSIVGAINNLVSVIIGCVVGILVVCVVGATVGGALFWFSARASKKNQEVFAKRKKTDLNSTPPAPASQWIGGSRV